MEKKKRQIKINKIPGKSKQTQGTLFDLENSFHLENSK